MRNGKQEVLHGVRPRAPLTTGRSRALGILFLVLAATVVSPAQDEQLSPNAVMFKSLVSFDGTNGANPTGSLVQGTDGNLYGTAATAGTNGAGNVFKMTPSGSLAVRYNFCAEPTCPTGAYPVSLVLGTDGNFYGITAGGGAYNNSGTVFKITLSGALTTLYNFCALTNCPDGQTPDAGLVQGADGNFYGTTFGGGTTADPNCVPAFGGCGTIFKITTEGALTTLYNFCSQPNCADGGNPLTPLIQATDGSFYGTTQGVYHGGTIFKITPKGEFTTLYNFPDGLWPVSPLVQAANGNFYGLGGYGAYNEGQIFELTPAGALTTFYSFCAQTSCPDGAGPTSVVQATDRNFYGITALGGTNCVSEGGCGTVFKITPGGTLTTLHSFDGTDGNPSVYDYLVQATNGAIYGLTYQGGASNAGTVFRVSVGLAPFVETVPTSGEVGAKVTILGTALTGATSVTFNGVAATFAVVSATEITTSVPTGATIGKVEVVTPIRTLKSNGKFQVRP